MSTEVNNDINQSIINNNEDKVDDKITDKISIIDKSIKRLTQLMTKPEKNRNVYLKNLETAFELIEWTLKKYKLMFASSPKYIFKRDIYYCELGKNIGSEQGGRRPVVIIQNDNGNKSSTTTMIAVITTHQGSKLVKVDNYYELHYNDNYGNNVKRKLSYYEIPVELEKNPHEKIEGIINLSQIYTISKKRLVGNHVAKITEDCFYDISSALLRMFDIKLKKKI
ncbi:type II toxin-antitoxin system PemK/MazF family toxin [Clostridium intestinale]|uniref:mRNA interferase MazF n=1 Tax=Clostridium intestinale DSM 6191 TaxID=1121320 RepID=A0A1M5ZQG8_9CLOT|nr:type II toxin-antitoxin system PemK/MazF family toxin [Clostridium intestinale]SHI26527.1 mRNA interferase MazF [Clostridium intestinale DSM 6191]